MAEVLTFEAAEAAVPGEALIVEVDGFEGPLDLLLALARDQKVDLAKISILRLADQYLEFVERARKRRLELAAEYLVMAAWLAFLKSRLVLPQPDEGGEPAADEMAARLRWRLLRLKAMRDAAARLMTRDRLGREVFARGNPEPVRLIRQRTHKDTLYDLLTAYANQRVRRAGHRSYDIARPVILLIEEARERIERMLGRISDWSSLARYLPFEWAMPGPRRRSAYASTLSACLELVRDGKLQIRQLTPFGEVYIKDRGTAAEEGTG